MYGHVISILLLAVFFGHTAAYCTAGEYPPNMQACEPCPQGTWSPDDYYQTECIECPIGTYAKSESSATGCWHCGWGQTTSEAGRWKSDQCGCAPGNHWVLDHWGNWVCVHCDFGEYNPDGWDWNDCFTCDNGFVSNAQRTGCDQCPDDETTQSAGEQCECILPKRRSASGEFCLLFNCAAGYYTIDAGNAGYEEPTCDMCHAGTFQASRSLRTTCRTCPVGKFADTTGTVECTDCNAGTYTSSTGSEVCSTCPSGTSSLSGSYLLSHCKCMVGYSPSSDGAHCNACDPGTYASGVGSVSCGMCPVGTYQPASGQGVCLTCPDGTSSISGSDALTNCTCVVGYVAASDGVQCSECAAGSRSSNGDEDGIGSRTCTTCPTGTYAGPGSDRCISCPIHSNTHGEAAVAASYCECIQGYYSNDFVVDDASCIACEENTYKDSHGSGLCTSCPTNTISDAGSTELSQCICKVGYTHIENGLACAECEDGTFKNITGAVECTICPYHRSSAVASVSESDCKCVAGYYGESCIHCPTGTVSTFDAATIHDCLCMAGWFRVNEICVPCPIGSYKLEIGDGICTNCLVV